MFAKAAVAAFMAHRALLGVNAQDSGVVPLASQTFTYTALPYQADPNNGERGAQSGYNICNSTVRSPEVNQTHPMLTAISTD
jgi:hypothetical protein